MRLLRLTIRIACLAAHFTAFAATVGSVRGVIHDPQHRPVQDAMVMIKAKTSDWSSTTNSDANGNFAFNAVPLGEYTVTVAGVGFETGAAERRRHLRLRARAALRAQHRRQPKRRSTSPALPRPRPPIPSTPTTLVNRLEIARTPGADRTNSLAMITDYVPGAYVTHDQLHIRGGHQTSWLIDGVPVPNTNIASNLGPQFDPKDIDYWKSAAAATAPNSATAPTASSTSCRAPASSATTRPNSF